MADDTRLADACLLLNYSSQSYREQMLLTKKLQKQYSSSNQKLVIDSEPFGQTTEKSVTSKLITPPPEHIEPANSPISDEFTPTACSNVDISTTIDSPPSDEATLNNRLSFYEECNYSGREPIQNLLAAVNCALPGLKSRPNILQRCPINSYVPSFPSNIIDHDYCQQVQNYLPLDRTMSNQLDKDDNHSSQSDIFGTVTSEDQSSNVLNKRKQKFDQTVDSFSTKKRPFKLVAVHLGAGNSTHESESMHLAKSICEEVMLQTINQDVIKGSKKKRKLHENVSKQGECCSINLKDDTTSADYAVVQLIKRMEDHQALNCGYGSNLNMLGQVECDASLMSDRTHMWAGVGALSGCKNPILLAKSLYDHRNVPRPLGLVQPNLLVGSGAKQWMREHCSHLSIMDSKMISQKSFSTYQKLKSRYDTAVRASNQEKFCPESSKSLFSLNPPTSGCSRPRSRSTSPSIPDIKTHFKSTSLDHGFYCATTKNNLQKAPSFARAIDRVKKYDLKDDQSSDYGAKVETEQLSKSLNTEIDLHHQEYKLDTVGAIAVDSDNNFASAISSGGLLLKYRGRVGQAAVPGAGCWSEDSVAVTTTGVGEYLTLNLFARKFYDKMLTLRLLYDLGHVEKKPDLSSLISCAMEECFEDLLKSSALDHVPLGDRLAGMMAITTLNSKNSPKRIDDKDLYLSYAHNTNSMCIGYMTCNDSVGHSVMSLRSGGKDGEPLVKTMKFTLDQPDK